MLNALFLSKSCKDKKQNIKVNRITLLKHALFKFSIKKAFESIKAKPKNETKK